MKHRLGILSALAGAALTLSLFGAADASAAPAEHATVHTTARVVAGASAAQLIRPAAVPYDSHITIPSNYVYNPTTTYQRTLHDYCSYSPDSFFSANFRGPCARHDMCYQYHQQSQVGCDNWLWINLSSECRYTYAWYNPMRQSCLNTADIYYAAVLLHTIWPF